jgi:hypothetical protein
MNEEKQLIEFDTIKNSSDNDLIIENMEQLQNDDYYIENQNCASDAFNCIFIFIICCIIVGNNYIHNIFYIINYKILNATRKLFIYIFNISR